MRRRWIWPAAGLALLILAFVLEQRALALTFPRSLPKLLALRHQIRPLHLAIGFILFGVAAIVSNYREWSGLVTFVFSFASLACIGTCLVWVLVYGQHSANESRALLTATREEDAELLKRPAPLVFRKHHRPKGTAGIGADCERTSECADGALCAKIGHSRNCWRPCRLDDTCGPGFRCVAPRRGNRRVCVQ